MERFTLITYNISFIFTYLLHIGRHSTLYMNARVSQYLSALCLWNLSLSISKRKTSFLYTNSLFSNKLCPPQQAFSSSHKIQFIHFPIIEACAHNLCLAPPESTTAQALRFESTFAQECRASSFAEGT